MLDGQQRPQSLYIGLIGDYEEKELYLDVLSGEITAPDDIKYKFSFLNRDEGAFPWIKLKDIVFDERALLTAADKIIRGADRDLNDGEIEKIKTNTTMICKTFSMDENISYQELDSIDNPTIYKEEDVVEIFIRANSGGTKLGKSDLLFSLLSSSWERADENMESLLEELNLY